MATDKANFDTIFCAAIEMPAPDARAAFIAEACGTDAELRTRIEKLVAAHFRAGSFLETPSPDSPVTVDQPIREETGTMVGPYKLLDPIGEGGMGTVWMAQQSEPIKRLVAIKLIKPGMDSKQVLARFDAERQALALMDHPNIAKVFDAGSTEDREQRTENRRQKTENSQNPLSSVLCPLSSGRPYFVMELVKGVPITKYCDEHHLTPRQRLELFIPVCQAIQHAHQKGIIHRDIKPSNVLVAMYDDRPVPKVIDFGVAKATGVQLTEATLHTGFGAVVGTIEYMSPEQANFNQLDVDTRSDIYSLGVLLYELLAGSPPFTKKDLEEAGMLEMLRVIREQEPSKPSTKLSSSDALPSLSANRGTEPSRLAKLVRGELDWIVMKALEKDRTRRYETANGFAMDVQRYLADEPVQACPPSAGYRLRKFARRNKSLFVTAGIVAAALLLGIVGTTWQAIRATNASTTATVEADRANREASRATTEAQRAIGLAEQARTEAAIAKAVNDFVNEDLLAQANPYNEPDREIKLRTLVERAAAKIESRFHDQPLVEAAIRQTLGGIHGSLGDPRKAEEQYRRAFEIYRRDLGLEHRATAWSMTSVATALNGQGRYVEAEKLLREAIEIRKRILGPEHRGTLTSLTGLAISIAGQGHLADAEELHREVYEVRRRVLGPEHPDTLASKTSIAFAMNRQGHSAEAEKLYREALEIQRRVLRPEHPELLSTMTLLAAAVREQNRLSEAEELHRQVYQTRKRVLGPEHPETLNSMNFLAAVMEKQGRHAEAKPLWDEGMVHSRQGHAFEAAGRRAEAANSFRQAIAALGNLADEFPATPKYRQQLGHCCMCLYYSSEDSTEKDLLLQQALPLWEQLAADFPKIERNWCELGQVHFVLGHFRKAADCQSKAIGLNGEFWDAWHRRGWTHANLGQWKDALADHQRTLELNPKHWRSWWGRGHAYSGLKQWAKAVADYEQAVELGATEANVWLFKSAALARLNQPDEAITELRQAIAKGFVDGKYLKDHDDLAALREREDFKNLLADLEAKNK